MYNIYLSIYVIVFVFVWPTLMSLRYATELCINNIYLRKLNAVAINNVAIFFNISQIYTTNTYFFVISSALLFHCNLQFNIFICLLFN